MNSSESEQRLLHYRLGRQIGRGGMGEVYQAEDTKLGRSVAIKFLPVEIHNNARARQRFVQEAQSASSLNHPNIITIYAIEEVDGRDFIVMEYVEGRTLKECIEHDGALPLNQLLDIGIQAADALEAAHEVDLVHRDIKPANILISNRGRAKLLDFGLAKVVRTIAGDVDFEAPTWHNLTDEGTVLGTVSYMSPEQTRGEVLDYRSDIFSLGSVLYEAATRSLPFNGPSLLSTMHEIATAKPLAPSLVRPDLPPDFDLIIERSLAKEKEQRYASAAELAQALRNLRANLKAQWSGIPIVYDKDLVETTVTSSFVGREPELTKMEALLRQTTEGSGRIVFITGEPGIGKTSLSDEFLRRARVKYPSLTISRGRCIEQYGTGEAYLPFLDAIGEILDGPARDRLASIMRVHAPTWCAQLPAAFASTAAIERIQQETIGATKERMMREMGDALGLFANMAPVALLLEDLHWADPSSVDLLRHLCHRIHSQRLLIVATFRPEDIERNNHPLKNYRAEMRAHNLCEEISLDSLTREHIALYLDSAFAPNDFPDEFSSLIHDKTEGHPLFATSLLHYLQERGDIARKNEHWTLARPIGEMELEAPESVRSMIARKIDALTEEEQRALQYASVEGAEFLSTIAAALLEIDEVDFEERMASMEKTHRLIVTKGEEELPDGSLATRYRFSHALYQNFLYKALVNKRRIMLHRQAGERLLAHYGKRAPQIATQLALHFDRGRDFERAVEFMIHAGDHATKLYGNAEAAEHYTNALNLAGKLGNRQTDTVVALYQKRGGVNMALSRFDEAVDDYKRMLKQVEATGELEKQAMALNALATVLFFSHRVEEMAKSADRALAVAKAAGSEQLRLETMCLMAMKHLCYGELAVGRPILDDVIASARAIDHKPALAAGLVWRACLYFFQTEYEKAIAFATEGRQLASQLRDAFLLLTAMFFLGLSNGNLGRMSTALALLEEAIRRAARNGDRFWHPRMPNCIGWVHRELQDFEGASKHNQEGLEVGRQYHVLEAEANSLINIGIDHTHLGQADQTVAAFEEVRDIFARDAWFRWRYNIRLEAATALHWLRQRDLPRAREYALRLLKEAETYEVHKYIAEAHRLLARIALAEGDNETAEKEFGIALDELEHYPVPVLEWRLHADLGRMRLKAGDAAAARESFNRAAAVLQSFAESVKDEGLRAIFLNSNAVRAVMAGAAGTPAENSFRTISSA